MAKSYSTKYKDVYDGTWSDAEKKERRIIEVITETLGEDSVIASGFGAGSTERIEGSSGSHGHQRAAPDLEIVGTNIVVEVTGPLQYRTYMSDIMVNMTKIMYAESHPEQEYWVAHMNGMPDTFGNDNVRMLLVGELFQIGVDNGTIIRDQFESRRGSMFFQSIPKNHPATTSLGTFLAYLKIKQDA